MTDNEILDTKKSKKIKKDGAGAELSTETSESTDLSSVFFSHYNTSAIPVENKKRASIIECFIICCERKLSTFLGRKTEVTFEGMKVCEIKELNLDKTPVILSSALYAPYNQTGLLFFDYALMQGVMDILFGAGPYKNKTTITTLGKFGIVIAKKLSELCLSALQEAVSEYEHLQINLLKTTEQRSLILNQSLPDQVFNLTFQINLEEIICRLNIAIPDAIFNEITAQAELSPIENQQTSMINDAVKKDIIDSTITLTASLQDIKLKITDIMNLKSGDLIPIQDPTIVCLSHHQKKLFKGSVGQSNAVRVVKIIDSF
jgi:flagellar motor switch protein FliM